MFVYVQYMLVLFRMYPSDKMDKREEDDGNINEPNF